MMKHEQQTSRLEKSSTFFGGNNFSRLNLYMKSLFVIASLLLLVSNTWSENLIQNTDFKLDMSSGLPAGWRLSPNAAGERIELPEAAGKFALKLSGSKTGERSWWIQYLNNFKTGQLYRLNIKVRGTAGTKSNIYAECNKPWKTVGCKEFECTGNWQNISFDFEFETLDVQPYLVLRMTAPGEVVFSDPVITQTGRHESNIISNALFEQTDMNGLPSEWYLSKGSTGKRVSADTADGSKYMLELVNDDAAKNAFFQQHSVRVKAGLEYLLKVKFKGIPGTIFKAYMECNNPWRTFSSKEYECIDEWQELTLKINFPELNSLPYAVFRIKGKGKVVFMNPALSLAPGQFVNGDFSAGNERWKIRNGNVIDSKSEHGRVLELSSQNGAADAVQNGIQVKNGQRYRISYQVRGGSDKKYTDSQGATWFRIMPVANGMPVDDTGTWYDSFDSWQAKRLAFKAPGNVIGIVCELKTPGKVWFDNIVFEECKSEVEPLEIVLDVPFSYRNGIYATNKGIKTFSGIVLNELPGVQKFAFEFNGKSLLLNAEKNSVTAFELPLPDKPGTYPITVQALDSDGKELGKHSLTFTVNAPGKREVTFNSDHIMLIDGEPFFPLGFWSVGGNKANPEKMKLMAEAGFNIGRCSSDQLDDLSSAGLMGLVHVIAQLPKFNTDAQFKRWNDFYVAEMHKTMQHPSLAGYCNIDEPAWGGIPYPPIAEAYEYIRKIDPYRPIMLNEAPRGKVENLRPYAEACDTYGVDIYPVPGPNSHSDLQDKMMTSVGKYTDISREVVRDRKPVWMTLQGFAWGIITKRAPAIYPVHQENRFMAYNAIVHGATGLFWWGFNVGGDENWEFIKELGRTIHELREMSPVLISPSVKSEKLTSNHPEIAVLHKVCEGRNYYIVLNESGKSFSAELRGNFPVELNVLFENRKLACKNNIIADEFAPYDVHIYTDALKLPLPLKLPQTQPVCSEKFQSTDDFKSASWIWYPGKHNTPSHKAYFIRKFSIPANFTKVELYITADDMFQANFNGKLVIEHNNTYGFAVVSALDITKDARTGENCLAIKAADAGIAPCGLIFAIRITEKNGTVTQILSDTQTLTSEKTSANWLEKDFTPAGWEASEVIGKYGCQPWGHSCRALPADSRLLGAFDFP